MERSEMVEAPKTLVDEKDEIDVELSIQTLEKETSWEGGELYQYNGFWFRALVLRPILRSQKFFKAHNTDIILCTLPKSGTTWLKALTFTILNRNIYSLDQSTLLTTNPNGLVPFLEINTYMDHENPDLENIPSPRLFSAHMPYQLLPNSVHQSQSRIIYVSRNPLDHFVSHRHFVLENLKTVDKNYIEGYHEPVSLDESFDKFCKGIHSYGPFCDHVKGYWDAHIKNPQKVLFLKYEDLKQDIASYVKMIAQFIGMPFSLEEEKNGLIQQIANLCSLANLKDLEVNKTGKSNSIINNSSYFRKGQVGDWANYLTPEMAQRFENLLDAKLKGSGLKFRFSEN